MTPLTAAIIIQALLGLVFLIGFVAIMRRFMDKEVPAQLAAISERLGRMEQRLERVSSEFRSFELRIQHHIGRAEARLDNLEGRGAGRSHGET